jgi:hypothetical protein
MRFLTRILESIRAAFRPTPEPVNFAAINRNWPAVTTRGRWVAA